MEFWRNVLKRILLTHTGFGEHWDQGRAGQGKVLIAAVMAKNKAHVSHIQIWKWTQHLPTHSLATQSSEGLGLLNYRRPLCSIWLLPSPRFSPRFVDQRSFSTYSNYLSLGLPILILPSGLLSNIFLTTLLPNAVSIPTFSLQLSFNIQMIPRSNMSKKNIHTRAVFFQPPMGYKKKTNWHNIIILLPKVQQGLTYFST